MSRRGFRLLFTAGLAAGLAGACWTARAASGLERLRESGTILIGHRESAPPFSYVVNGEVMGYSIDICRHIAAAAARSLGIKNWNIGFKTTPATQRLEMIERGDIDLECAGTSNNAERRARVSFTIPHFIAVSRLMVRDGDQFERIEDLAGRPVVAMKGTTNLQLLKQQSTDRALHIQVKEAADRQEALRWLADKRVDAFAWDDSALFTLMAESRPGQFKVIGRPMAVEAYAIALRKGDSGLKKVADDELRRLIYSGELRRLYEKWFRSPVPPRGMNLNMPMSKLLIDYIRLPTDFVPN